MSKKPDITGSNPRGQGHERKYALLSAAAAIYAGREVSDYATAVEDATKLLVIIDGMEAANEE